MSKVYEIVTERIVKALKAGTVPWRRPWKAGYAGAGPMSLSTGLAYRGINRVLLDPCVSGYDSQWWGTYREIEKRGGHVKKGERASIACFWTLLRETKKEGEGKGRSVPLLRYYNVFNLEQCEGVEAPPPPQERPFSPIEACEDVVLGMPMPPKITESGGGHCYYSPSRDAVCMTPKGAFRSEQGWYATLFHELAHSTGAAKRLGRDLTGGFASKAYAREELCAEVCSAFLCAECGIDTADIQGQTAAYIRAWLNALANDPKLVIVAAGAAQRACDYILGRDEEAAVEVAPAAWADSLWE